MNPLRHSTCPPSFPRTPAFHLDALCSRDLLPLRGGCPPGRMSDARQGCQGNVIGIAERPVQLPRGVSCAARSAAHPPLRTYHSRIARAAKELGNEWKKSCFYERWWSQKKSGREAHARVGHAPPLLPSARPPPQSLLRRGDCAPHGQRFRRLRRGPCARPPPPPDAPTHGAKDERYPAPEDLLGRGKARGGTARAAHHGASEEGRHPAARDEARPPIRCRCRGSCRHHGRKRGANDGVDGPRGSRHRQQGHQQTPAADTKDARHKTRGEAAADEHLTGWGGGGGGNNDGDSVAISRISGVVVGCQCRGRDRRGHGVLLPPRHPYLTGREARRKEHEEAAQCLAQHPRRKAGRCGYAKWRARGGGGAQHGSDAHVEVARRAKRQRRGGGGANDGGQGGARRRALREPPIPDEEGDGKDGAAETGGAAQRAGGDANRQAHPQGGRHGGGGGGSTRHQRPVARGKHHRRCPTGRNSGSGGGCSGGRVPLAHRHSRR